MKALDGFAEKEVGRAKQLVATHQGRARRENWNWSRS